MADLGPWRNQRLAVERVDMERREGNEELLLRRLHPSVPLGYDLDSLERNLSERCRQLPRHRNRHMGKFRADSHHVGCSRHCHNRTGEVSHGTSEASGRTTRENTGSPPSRGPRARSHRRPRRNSEEMGGMECPPLGSRVQGAAFHRTSPFYANGIGRSATHGV